LKSTAGAWNGEFTKGDLQMQQQTKPPPAFIPQSESRARWLKSLEERDGRRYFRSGFDAHDRTAGALLRAGLYLVAARAGIGKTAFLFSLAYRQALAGIRVHFCNLEMSVEQMWHRLACLRDPDLTLHELNEGERTAPRAAYFEKLSAELEKFSPLFFESTDVAAMLAAARNEIKKSSDSILFVDYVGLLTMRGLGPEQRYWLISESAKQLKLLARDLDIPVVAAVQLNRAIENRKDKTPNLADLRDSGELENHADGVFALTRGDRDILEIDVLKNRHGPLVSYSLHFDGPRCAVEDFDK
jgi:replicative DNA helicase